MLKRNPVKFPGIFIFFLIVKGPKQRKPPSGGEFPSQLLHFSGYPVGRKDFFNQRHADIFCVACVVAQTISVFVYFGDWRIDSYGVKIGQCKRKHGNILACAKFLPVSVMRKNILLYRRGAIANGNFFGN